MQPTSIVRAAPLTTVLLGVVGFALLSTMVSLWPVTPLERRPGFTDAVASLDDPTAFVVVGPPEHTAALDAIPHGLHASDGMPPSAAARSRYSSITLVAPHGGSLPLTAKEERKSFKEVDVVRYTSGERVLFDLSRDLSQIRLSLRGEPDIACNTTVEGGIGCAGRPSWNHVGPKQLRVNGQDWPCTWAHPVAGYGLELSLGERDLGSHLILDTAFDDPAAGHGAPVDITVRVGDSEQHFTRGNGAGVTTYTVPTANGTRAPVVITLRTENDAQRHLGIRLRLVQVVQ